MLKKFIVTWEQQINGTPWIRRAEIVDSIEEAHRMKYALGYLGEKCRNIKWFAANEMA